MNWGLAAAVASAAAVGCSYCTCSNCTGSPSAVAAASGAELLACDCDAAAPPAVGRCDGLLLSRQHHDEEVREVRLLLLSRGIKDSFLSLLFFPSPLSPAISNVPFSSKLGLGLEESCWKKY